MHLTLCQLLALSPQRVRRGPMQTPRRLSENPAQLGQAALPQAHQTGRTQMRKPTEAPFQHPLRRLAHIAQIAGQGFPTLLDNEQPQDFIGSLKDAFDARVAQYALVGEGAHIATPTRHLHQLIGRFPHRFAGIDLGYRCLNLIVQALLRQPGRHLGHAFRDQNVHRHLRYFALHQLVLGDARAKGLAFFGPLDRQFQAVLHRSGARCGQPQPPAVQYVHGDAKALTRLSEHVLRRDANVVETQHCGIVPSQAHFLGVRSHRISRERWLQQKCGQRILAVDLRRPRKHGDHTGDVTVADPDLAAVESPPCAIAHRYALDGLGIAARLRLGEGKCGNGLTCGEARQIARFLLVTAVQQETFQADRQVRPEQEHERGAHMGDGLDHSSIGADAQSQATVLLGDGQTKEAHLGHRLPYGIGNCFRPINGAGVDQSAGHLVERCHEAVHFGRLARVKSGIGQEEILTNLASEEGFDDAVRTRVGAHFLLLGSVQARVLASRCGKRPGRRGWRSSDDRSSRRWCAPPYHPLTLQPQRQRFSTVPAEANRR